MGGRTETLTLPGAPEIAVTVRRSARARRMSLRVSRLDGRVTLSLPRAADLATARAFLADRAGWVRRHLADRPAPHVPRIGGSVAVAGRPLPIVAGRGRGARLCDGDIAVDPVQPVPPQIAGLLKTLARERLAPTCDGYAARIGRPYTGLALRDTRSRWGSCSSAGRLMFSWRLAMAPPEVMDYVAAHEVAHLAEMNHSAAFWDMVARLCPDHADRRAWLRRHGAALHAVRFTP